MVRVIAMEGMGLVNYFIKDLITQKPVGLDRVITLKAVFLE